MVILRTIGEGEEGRKKVEKAKKEEERKEEKGRRKKEKRKKEVKVEEEEEKDGRRGGEGEEASVFKTMLITYSGWWRARRWRMTTFHAWRGIDRERKTEKLQALIMTSDFSLILFFCFMDRTRSA